MGFIPFGPSGGGGVPSGPAGGDLGSTYPNPTVTATHLSAALPVAQGGTGQATAAAAFAALAPLTTLGDVIYEDTGPAPARLAGNTTATKKFLTQTGTGSASAAPGWNAIVAGDLPTGTTSAQGALQLDGTAGDIQASPGTGAPGNSGLSADAKHIHPQPPSIAPTAGGTAGRWMGFINTSASPATGTWLTGDWVVDIGGPTIWICTAGGTPGTWHAAGGVQNSGFTTIAGAISAFGNIGVKLAGNGLAVVEGSNCKQGVATLSGGTIVVANTSVTSTSRIQLTAQDNNSTGALRISARTGGTSFTITSSNAGDTGVVAYEIFEPG